jgi:hypothetical protein
VFLDRLGIPSTDMSFRGSYGVYHSIYDSHYWMSQFGDPTFQLHKVTHIIIIIAIRLLRADHTVVVTERKYVRVSCVVRCVVCHVFHFGGECRRVRRCGV